MPEEFEVDDSNAVARLTVVKIIDDLRALVEVNKIQIKFLAHGIDVTEQILMLLLGTIDVALLVNQPGDLRVGAEFFSQLLGADAGGAHKIRPPVIVRIS